MSEYLEPHEYHRVFTTINFSRLFSQGYHNYILDVDNTIVKRKQTTIDHNIYTAILSAINNGYIRKLCLLSNITIKNSKRTERIKNIAKQLRTDYFVCAHWPNLKPKMEPFLQAMNLMGSIQRNTVVIGDQLFTDIQGGNQLGLYTILVKPLGSDHIMTVWKRLPEILVIKTLKIKPI